MIKQIGTKIYYCLFTGNVIKIIGEMQGCVNETTFDEDYEIYKELNERNKSTIGLIKYSYGDFSSNGATSIMVDLETNEVMFTYETLPEIQQGPNLEERVVRLEKAYEQIAINLDLPINAK